MSDRQLQICITNDPTYVENGYTVYFREGGPCWIIDPGLPPQAGQIVQFVREHSLEPVAIVLTHAHADHIGGIDEVRDNLGARDPALVPHQSPRERLPQRTAPLGDWCGMARIGIPVYLAKEEWAALSDPMENLSGMMGPGFSTKVTEPLDLRPGETIELDGSRWEILDTSGHSPGGRTLYCRKLGIAFVGDAVFAGSVGRVDFPHSDGDRLMRNIRERLMTLPDDTRVLSGHGPETTVGRERTTNPFIIHGL